jgi:hypothetical protein
LNQGSYGFLDFKMDDFFVHFENLWKIKLVDSTQGGFNAKQPVVRGLPSTLPSACMPVLPTLRCIASLQVLSSQLLLARHSNLPTPASELAESPLLSSELAIEPRLPCVPGHHVSSCCLLCCALAAGRNAAAFMAATVSSFGHPPRQAAAPSAPKLATPPGF